MKTKFKKKRELTETEKLEIATMAEFVSGRYKGRQAETVYFAVAHAISLWEQSKEV